MMSGIHVINLTVAYGSVHVLRGVTLKVEPREVLAVVGPSGAGKSSLLLSLCGILPAQAGSVEVDGIHMLSLPSRARDKVRRRKFGFVFQFGDLVPELTLLENVSLPLRLVGEGYRAAMGAGRAQMKALGIDHLARRAVTEVSGGEMQRAAICRALVHRPPVVLADEPTGALDDQNSSLVFDQLLSHSRNAGAAVVLVTHQSDLAKRADRVLRIESGEMVDDP